MGDAIGKRVRFIVGLVVPVLLTTVLAVFAAIKAMGYQAWGFIGSALLMAALLFGPFVIYHFALRTPEFSIGIGVLLVAAAIYSVVEMINAMGRGSSTAGLALLWLPLIGYPVVAVGAFLDRLSR